jgi:hypothetical protein
MGLSPELRTALPAMNAVWKANEYLSAFIDNL